MAGSMPTQGEQPRKEQGVSVWIISAIVFFVLLIAGLIYWGSATRKSLAPAFTESSLTYTEAAEQPVIPVDDPAQLGDAPKLVYAKRTVTGHDAQGNNTYHTELLKADRTGERVFPFYATDDLTYEQVALYDSAGFVVYSPLLGTTPLVIAPDGVTRDLFVPQSVGNLFSYVFSPDGAYLAYLQYQDTTATDDTSDFVPESTVVIRNMQTGEETRVASSLFVHGDTKYSRLSLRALSGDGMTLYVTAVWPGQNYGDPESFFAVDWRNQSVRELTYSSLDEQGAENVLEFVGVYPDRGFAILNRGALLPGRSGGLTDRIQLERLDLVTGDMTIVYDATSGSISNVLQDPLSPDGTRIAIDNDVVQGGFRIVDLETNEVFPSVEGGIFYGWAGDNDHLVYEIRQDNPDAQEKYIALKVLNLDDGNIREIYRQTVVQEGTGLNAVGDVLYSYIGAVN